MTNPHSTMQTVSHSLAHRTGPGMSRPRARWQPYSPAQARSNQVASYLHTPASSVSSSPPTTTPSSYAPSSSICLTEPSPNALPLARHGSLRELQKSRYVTALVDQAVKSLTEIWQPQDIPAAFSGHAPRTAPVTQTFSEPILSSSSAHPFLHAAQHHHHHQLQYQHHHRNGQLPSPLTPSLEPSPFCTPSTSPVAPLAPSAHVRPCAPVPAPVGATAAAAATAAIPIRGFVHEVLRRSKTSANVLQTALCYITAVRTKIPELVRLERAGMGSCAREIPIEERIVREEEEALNPTFSSDITMATTTTTMGAPATPASSEPAQQDTVRIADEDDCTTAPAEPILADEPALLGWTELRKSRVCAREETLPPLPALPSPLLCPRRTFLAAIILASKFMQDKSYSNKAWAKLAGLPAREVGRCERALGAALDWRLWVGKLPSSSSASSSTTTTASAPTSRPCVRSQSAGDLLVACTVPPSCAVNATALAAASAASTARVLAAQQRAAAAAIVAGCGGTTSSSSSSNAHRLRSGLGRSSTLPVEAFASQCSGSSSSSASTVSAPMAASSPLAWTTTMMTPAATGCSPAGSVPPFWSTPASLSAYSPASTMDGYSPYGGIAAFNSSSSAFATPALTYSPASTVSSAGSASDDPTRTIQMLSFCDVEIVGGASGSPACVYRPPGVGFANAAAAAAPVPCAWGAPVAPLAPPTAVTCGMEVGKGLLSSSIDAVCFGAGSLPTVDAPRVYEYWTV